MTTVPSFNAAAWIAENTYGGTRLSNEASAAVASFTTMWNFFEGTVCKNRACVPAFERIAHGYDPSSVPTATLQALDDSLTFWQFRYRTPDDFAPGFDGLHFRKNDRRDHVERVLKGQMQGPKDKVLALMVIMYRLRNNLFHGIKTLEMLNDQVQNLNNASRCLAALLEAVQPHLVVASNQQAGTA